MKNIDLKGPCSLLVKARGELAEAHFLVEALERGITVAKPFGDSAKFDFLIEAGGRLSRVQIKSAWTRGLKGYKVTTGPGCSPSGRVPRRKYRRNEIDFLAAYIAPEDAWFIFPIAAVHSTFIRWNSVSTRRLERYREAWRLLFPCA